MEEAEGALGWDTCWHSDPSECTGWNVVRAEIIAEVSPRDFTSLSGIFVLLPPISGLVLELEGDKLDIILRSHVTALEMLFDVCYPVFSI